MRRVVNYRSFIKENMKVNIFFIIKISNIKLNMLIIVSMINKGLNIYIFKSSKYNIILYILNNNNISTVTYADNPDSNPSLNPNEIITKTFSLQSSKKYTPCQWSQCDKKKNI